MNRLDLCLICCLVLLAPVALAEGLGTGAPAMNVYPADDADRPVIPRRYPGAPPGIPHGVAGYRITLKSNECLDCHTPTPAHFTNPFTGRSTPEAVVGTRYNCTQCHAPQALEEPPYSN